MKNKAKEQFENIRVKDQKLESWILEDVFADDSSWFNQEKTSLGKDSDKVESQTQNLVLKYRLLLIDKVLERATKGE